MFTEDVMKKCKDCGKRKPLGEFYRHKGMADGHLNSCKECKRAYQSNRPREIVAEIEHRRNQKPERKKHLARNLKQWRRNNPEKAKAQRDRYPERRKARTVLGNAIRDGHIQRQPCEVCGTTEDVEAHHRDYSKPLDVNWLCGDHHRESEGR